MEALRPRNASKTTTTSSKKKAIGSDLSSARGSEDRHSSVQAPTASRGQKRGRELETEKVGKRARTVNCVLSAATMESRIASPKPRSESPLTSLSPHSSDSNGRPIHAASSTRNSAEQGHEKDRTQSHKLPTGLEILAGPMPMDPRNGNTYICHGQVYHMLRDPNDFDIGGQYIELPQLIKLIEERVNYNQANAAFFRGQTPDAPLSIAGYDKNTSLHKLKSDHKLTKNGNSQEESFYARPSVRLVIPDHLKALLVDDWENVTKNLQLVPLPSKTPANAILTTYFDEEKGKRRLGSAEADILEEVVQGIKEYFDKCLGRILLYRFEREQFFEIRKEWESGDGEWEGKGPGDIYGAEHLCRLFGKFLSAALTWTSLIEIKLISLDARTYRSNQHGPAIGQQAPRRVGQAHAVVGEELWQVLCQRVRKCEPGLH